MLVLAELVVFSLLQGATSDQSDVISIVAGLGEFKTKATFSAKKRPINNTDTSDRQKLLHETSTNNATRASPVRIRKPHSPIQIVARKNLWEDSEVLPTWMKEYFDWHKAQRSILNQENFRDFRFIVMRCLAGDARCGGTADRIKTVPLIIDWAAKTKRILLIHWSRPALLEEFLLPPEGGIDWRTPDWLVQHVVHGDFAPRVDAFQRKIANRGNQLSVRTKVQSYNGGSMYYNNFTEGPKFEEVYHDVWRALFTPSPPIQKLVREQMRRFNLRPGSYVAAHMRGLYAVQERKASQLYKMAVNALNCASNLRPTGPIYFASDSKVAIDHVVAKVAPEKSTQIVALQRDYEPLHLEKALNWENRTAKDYYDTFVDLYLLGMSRCLTYNVGGYGQWGLWISQDSSCFKSHGTKRVTNVCNWTGEETPVDDSEAGEDMNLFLRPMTAVETDTEANDEPSAGWDLPGDAASETTVGVLVEEDNPEDLWGQSASIPESMKEYFEWHRDTRKNLTKTNWQDTKYLVMQCLKSDERCGGLSDRIRPVPLMLMIAARSKRLLFIQWSRPFPLEDFLMPPRGGLNWTLPEWLGPLVQRKGAKKNNLAGLNKVVYKEDAVVRTRYQSNNHGAEYYNNQTEVGAFEAVYHDMFRVLFEPSPPVAEQIDINMESLRLVPGAYSAAHFRVLYGRESRPEEQTKKVAINAINCASELRPGGPVYFAADNKFAVDHIKEYAAKNSLPVVSVDHEDEPLHLDKATNWTARKPSEFYATFVDLYLLGQSRCTAYSNGGFGTFGLLLSFNSSCSVRYFSKQIIKQCPKWVAAAT